ncbi:hypothetical protein MK489_11450 [Myxococcota bacterium]|nr:hypothetical protein [Myxococcota bacterium]
MNHRSEEQLLERWQAGSTQERLDALHVLANRGEPSPELFGPSFVQGLLSHPDRRLLDVAFSTDISKFHFPEIQNEWLMHSNVDTPNWWMSYVLHHRKVGGYQVGGDSSLTRRELDWYLEAEKGIMPPIGDVIAHLRLIRDRARNRKEHLGIVPPHERSREMQNEVRLGPAGVDERHK